MTIINLFHGDKGKNGQLPVESNTGDIIFAFDIGSSVIRLTAGQVNSDNIVTILGYKERESQGVTLGAVVDISLLSSTLAQIIQEFETEYAFNLGSCVIAAPGYFICSDNVSGTSTVQSGTVEELDRRHAIESARAGIKAYNESEFDTVHMIVQNYETETSNSITNPLGQYAKRLNVNVHVVGLRRSHIYNMQNVLKSLRADLSDASFVYSGIAAADAVLTESQKELGVCLVDIGGGTTNAVVYFNRKLVMSFGLPCGGENITQAISKFFGISSFHAEQVKRKYGMANPMTIPEEQRDMVIKVHTVETDVEIRFEDLARLIERELNNILRLVSDEILRRTRDNLELSAGYVLTGGVAMIKDISKLYVQQGGHMVKICVGIPRGVEFGSERDRDLFACPDKAVTVGLLRNGYRAVREHAVQQSSGEQNVGFVRKLWNWIKVEMN